MPWEFFFFKILSLSYNVCRDIPGNSWSHKGVYSPEQKLRNMLVSILYKENIRDFLISHS